MKTEKWIVFVACLLTFGFVIFCCLIGPIMEARTFNKFTKGQKATFIDAMFSNLRVEACD